MKEQVKKNIECRSKNVSVSLIFSGYVLSGCLLGSLIFFTGCGNSSVETTQPASMSSDASPDAAEKEVKASVAKFLKAVREGKDEDIFQMLTPKARAVCGKDKLPSVPASDTADFRIDMVRILSDNEAQAQTTMIDYDLKGDKYEDSIAWALRKTEEGWKIAGTACVFFEGMEPIVVNFESKEAIAQAEKQVEQQQQKMRAQWEQMRSANEQQQTLQQTLPPAQQPQQQPQQQPHAQGRQPGIQR